MAKTVEERSAILTRAVTKYLMKGWVLQSRTDEYAQLTLAAKKYGTMARLLFGFWLLLGARRNRVLMLTVTKNGKIQKKIRKA